MDGWNLATPLAISSAAGNTCSNARLTQSTIADALRKLLARINGSQRTLPDAVLTGLQKQRHFRVAKPVDRLHRIPDEKERPAVAGFPSPGQELDEFQLRTRRILELVNEQVTNAVIEGQQEFGRLVNLSERRLCGKRELDEIDRLTLGENHAKFGDEVHEHSAQGFEVQPFARGEYAGFGSSGTAASAARKVSSSSTDSRTPSSSCFCSRCAGGNPWFLLTVRRHVPPLVSNSVAMPRHFASLLTVSVPLGAGASPCRSLNGFIVAMACRMVQQRLENSRKPGRTAAFNEREFVHDRVLERGFEHESQLRPVAAGQVAQPLVALRQQVDEHRFEAKLGVVEHGQQDSKGITEPPAIGKFVDRALGCKTVQNTCILDDARARSAACENGQFAAQARR